MMSGVMLGVTVSFIVILSVIRVNVIMLIVVGPAMSMILNVFKLLSPNFNPKKLCECLMRFAHKETQ
jgi:hypothetical protein